MTAIAEMPQHLQALGLANQVRIERARQRHALRHASCRTLILALVNPTPEMGSFRIGELFGRECSLVPGVGRLKFGKALGELRAMYPTGRKWNALVRLRDLSELERRRLVTVLVAAGWRSWREAV